ncbi:MAG TPA: sucrase ferredoxin [Jiangellaceae bacterium]|nr:sucrase ferredoxin [Jiangellaceae bacterium]
MTACSEISRLLDEPMVGTAPVAASWIVLEQPGPWGRDALTESHLDPVLGAALETASHAHGARVALVRRPGRHPDLGDRARRVWIASTRPGRTWLLGGSVADVADLGALSWPGIEAGDRSLVAASFPVLQAETDPLLLVCTNARRDVCCANGGRPLVAALREPLGSRVWETNHLGGHRFAPTAALLPHGVVYGRLDPADALAVYTEARKGRQLVRGYRGRSTFSRAGQAAEAAVRQHSGAESLDDLDVATETGREDGSWHVVVTHRDGRRFSVDVRSVPLEPARPESCRKPAVRPVAYIADPPVPRR